MWWRTELLPGAWFVGKTNLWKAFKFDETSEIGKVITIQEEGTIGTHKAQRREKE